jgi:hypothetical protein
MDLHAGIESCYYDNRFTFERSIPSCPSSFSMAACLDHLMVFPTTLSLVPVSYDKNGVRDL